MVMGTREMELMGYRSYRMCDKKAPLPIQDSTRNVEGGQTCLCCQTGECLESTFEVLIADWYSLKSANGMKLTGTA
jgi:hypothetical protein